MVVNGALSSWRQVTSGIPQGSVLGPILFIIFVNDMPEQVQSYIRMFTDDTKIFAATQTEEDCESLQEDIRSLQEWADQWQLRFNASKCAIMHLGFNNSKHKYEMSDGQNQRTLHETVCEKDLGVHVDNNLKFSSHIEKSVNKGNRILGLIRRTFNYLDATTVKQLYTALVRPHLEYGNSVWAPKYKKDALLLENVQRRATRLVTKLKKLDYEKRLEEMDLPSLAYRRLRGDLIEAYKQLNNSYDAAANIAAK